MGSTRMSTRRSQLSQKLVATPKPNGVGSRRQIRRNGLAGKNAGNKGSSRPRERSRRCAKAVAASLASRPKHSEQANRKKSGTVVTRGSEKSLQPVECLFDCAEIAHSDACSSDDERETRSLHVEPTTSGMVCTYACALMCVLRVARVPCASCVLLACHVRLACCSRAMCVLRVARVPCASYITLACNVHTVPDTAPGFLCAICMHTQKQPQKTNKLAVQHPQQGTVILITRTSRHSCTSLYQIAHCHIIKRSRDQPLYATAARRRNARIRSAQPSQATVCLHCRANSTRERKRIRASSIKLGPAIDEQDA
jgi:hypothetical protein